MSGLRCWPRPSAVRRLEQLRFVAGEFGFCWVPEAVEHLESELGISRSPNPFVCCKGVVLPRAESMRNFCSRCPKRVSEP